jgi:hypothetical protein
MTWTDTHAKEPKVTIVLTVPTADIEQVMLVAGAHADGDPWGRVCAGIIRALHAYV